MFVVCYHLDKANTVYPGSGRGEWVLSGLSTNGNRSLTVNTPDSSVYNLCLLPVALVFNPCLLPVAHINTLCRLLVTFLLCSLRWLPVAHA